MKHSSASFTDSITNGSEAESDFRQEQAAMSDGNPAGITAAIATRRPATIAPAAAKNRYGTARTTTKPNKPTPWDRLRDAESEGADALKAFIKVEQRSRDDRAQNEWEQYALWRPADRNYWTHIITPEGNRYKSETAIDCERFEGCPDTVFTDAVNAAARRLKIPQRLDTKHKLAGWLLERSLFHREREWVFCPASEGWPDGFVTVRKGGVR